MEETRQAEKEHIRMKIVLPELSRTQYEALIYEWIFSERDRAITRRKLLDGLTFEQLAEEFEISVLQAKRIVRKSEEILLRHAV